MSTMRAPISDAVIKRHAGDETVTELADVRYSALRFRYHKTRATGSWFLVTHQQGRTRWRRLGRWPELPARRLIHKLPELLAELTVRPDSPATLDTMETLDQILCWYRDRAKINASLTQRRRSAIASVIEKHLRPRAGHLTVAELNHHALDEQLIWPLQADYELSTVRYVFSILKTACKQAALMRLVAADPMGSMHFKDFIPASITPKPAALRPDDLPGVLLKISQSEPGPAMLCWLMLMYGTRIGETRLATRRQFDLGAGWWYIPATNTKTRKPLKLPLTDPALGLLKPYLEKSKGSALFPSSKGEPISETTANQWVQHVSDREWTAHDLRKLARTCWADLGVDWMVAELMLNHSLPGISQTYIHTHVEKQMQAALGRWHGELMECQKEIT